MVFCAALEYIRAPFWPVSCFVHVMDYLEGLREKLSALRQEHRDLDDVITRLEEAFPRDELQLRRLKKRKLQLRDEIMKIEGMLIPDIIA